MDNFTAITAYKVNWLRNKKGKKGASQMVIDSKNDNNIVVSMFNNIYGRMYADITTDQLKKLIKYNIYLCELITSYPHKVYFDIDNKKPADIKNKGEYMNSFINKINSIFPNSDMSVSGSENDIKYSYHIVLNNYVVSNENERTKLKNIVHWLKNNFNDAFDESIYTKNRLMKTIYQTKKDDPPERKQLKIINDDDEKHFITAFFNIDNVKNLTDTIFTDELNDELIKIENNKPLDLGKLPKVKIDKIKLKEINDHLITNNDITNEYLLSIAPLDGSFPHSYTFFVSLFCYFNNVPLDNYIQWYKQKTTDEAKINNKINVWTTLNKYEPVDVKTFKNMLSRHYPSLKISRYLLQLENCFNLEKYKQNIKHIDTITPEHFNVTDKYIIFNIGMGGGKTEQTINYLKLNKDKKFLIIAPNRSLGFNTYTRLQSAGLELEHYDIQYSTKKTKKFKAKEEMKDAKNLICCVNSLHYLGNNKYDIIILDEIETLNNKWFDNETILKHPERGYISWTKYIELCKVAEKIIILDAFISSQSLKFIDNIIQTNETMILYKRPLEISKREVEILPNFNMILNGVICKLKTNKKVLLYYPYKNGNKLNESMKDIEETINAILPTKKTRIYNADIDDEIKGELKDVNNYWVGYDLVIINSLVGVGINFDVINYFDSCFLCLAGFSSPRDVLQASCRPRHIGSNKIYVCFLSCRNTTDVLLNSRKLMNDDKIYNDLVDDLKTEKMAPIKGSFYLFCKMAGYRIKINSVLSKNEINDDVAELIEGKRLSYSYDTIDKISYTEAETIQDKLNEHIATAEDKVKLRKYFFMKMFIFKEPTEKQKDGTEQTNDELMAEAWDKKFNFFFEQLEKLTFSDIDPSIIQKIQTVNKWASIFPDANELKKMKLDEKLINELFVDKNKAYFARLKKESGHNTIIKTIYNNVFKMNIIASKADKSKHTNYIIDEIYYKMLKFGIENLKAHNNINNKVTYEHFDINNTSNSLDKCNYIFIDDEDEIEVEINEQNETWPITGPGTGIINFGKDEKTKPKEIIKNYKFDLKDEDIIFCI